MSEGPSPLATGVWGGEQVVLDVGADGATLRLGCAEGQITGPILLDAERRFLGSGSYTAFAGGPSTERERAVKASYEGALKGDQLTLTVTHVGGSERFTLVHGLQAKVIRCL